MLKQITLRNVTPELAKRLKALADARAMSVKGVVLSLLEDAVGIKARKQRLIEKYATWTEDDAAEFDEALRAQRAVDDDLWH